jgi:hypothetical protein
MTPHGKRLAEVRREVAQAFLRTSLAAGPVPVPEIRARAKAAGLPWRGILRAQAALGVESRKAGFTGGWTWSLQAKNGGGQGNAATPPTPNGDSVRDPLAEVVAHLVVTWTPAGQLASLSVPRAHAGAFAAQREAVFDVLRRARVFRVAAQAGCIGCRDPLPAGQVVCPRCQLALTLVAADGKETRR